METRRSRHSGLEPESTPAVILADKVNCEAREGSLGWARIHKPPELVEGRHSRKKRESTISNIAKQIQVL